MAVLNDNRDVDRSGVLHEVELFALHAIFEKGLVSEVDIKEYLQETYGRTNDDVMTTALLSGDFLDKYCLRSFRGIDGIYITVDLDYWCDSTAVRGFDD